MRPIYAQTYRSATTTPDIADLLGDPQPWMQDAACTRTDPDLFFPGTGMSTYRAKAVCRACPVVTECLMYAMSQPHMDGVWGGMSERARRDLRAQLRNERTA